MANKAAKSELRTRFFDHIFEDYEGYICIAISDPRAPKSRFKQDFFIWPTDSVKIEAHVMKFEERWNLYFCPHLLSRPLRSKENALPTDVLWADLDTASPDQKPEPQIVVRTSHNRWQAYWKLTMRLDPMVAEGYNKRIAYAMGADKSGHDLTQLLRVPFTYNHKYAPAPEIMVSRALTETRIPPLLFEALPKIEHASTEQIGEVPVIKDLPASELVIYKFADALRKTKFQALYTQEPDNEDDWSRLLWNLIHICFEAGMSAEETYVVTHGSSVNKYNRDHRPASHLWRDIQKAASGAQRLEVITANFRPLIMPTLIDLQEYAEPPDNDTFVTRYKDWAIQATDAIPDFHDLSAFIALSAIVANSVRLHTSNSILVPNLWGLILGDSTLSRKTTAMRMAVMDILMTIDQELILATDGSAEGLLTGLTERNNKTSVFYRDEVSGFFESINRRDYLAGLPETLTHLYDVPPVYTRRLRKEVIRIESPIFIFFGGGVRDRVYESLREEYVLSGFLPRFLVVSGDTDYDSLKRTGPPSNAGQQAHAQLISQMADLKEMYATDVPTNIGGERVMFPPRITAEPTQAAWGHYGDIEDKMLRTAKESSIPDLALPTFERMSRSLFKMSLIIAAQRQQPKDNKIVVEKRDVETAAWYIQRWGDCTIDLILNAGKRASERALDKIIQIIEDNPGILRSSIMQQRHLGKREADEILGTLEDRLLIRKEKQGRGWRYFLAGA